MYYSSNSICKAFLLLAISIFALHAYAQPLGYYRDPTIHNNKLVFTAQGDLWVKTINDTSLAKRLTTHPNVERGARFSPSGQQIAYVANYQNIPAVYVISTDGGIAKQVSYELTAPKLHNWIDDKTLLISTASDTGMHNSWVLKTLNIETLLTKTLPVFDAVEGVLSQNGRQLFFVQHGLQVSTDNANSYQGGAAGELWRFDVNSNAEATRLTDSHDGSVRTPMLFANDKQERVYFISNQSKLDNLWSMSIDGKDLKQHTNFQDWAVRKASMHNNQIVFQHGADIKAFNIQSGKVTTIPIQLQSDFVNLQTRYIKNPLTHFENASINYQGNKTTVVSRGKIAVANASASRLVNLATNNTSRNRNAIMSNDGRSVYVISDLSGDYEVWRFSATGGEEAEQLTSKGKGLKTGLWLAPNGKFLVYTEKTGGIFLLNLVSGKVKSINKKVEGSFRSIEFSHDSRYLTATVSLVNEDRSRIFLYELDSEKTSLLTSSKYDSYSPSFSADLNWLYFLSDRAFSASPSSPWGDRNMGPAFDKRSEVYAIALTSDAIFPFSPPTELDTSSIGTGKNKQNITEDEDEKSVDVKFDGVQSRLWQVGLPAGNYTQLIANEEGLFLIDDGHLKSLPLAYPASLKDMTGDIEELSISTNKKQLLIVKGKEANTELFIVPAELNYPSNTNDNKVLLNSWTMTINPQQEWQQMFKDAWLMHRDSLFDPNMRGLDWAAAKQKYLPLVSRITERSELNDVFEQMMGELNTLHSQVRGGDIMNNPNAPILAVLGASYTDSSEGVKINTIYTYDKDVIAQAPPLAKPGVDAKEGDIIIAVNNQVVQSIAQLHQRLLNTQDQQTLLTLRRNKKEIQTIVEPVNINRERRLRYQHWATQNLTKISAQHENIGYLHLYAMGANDLASFARDFYAQYKKHGLIIDVRRNRGGNIDSIIIEKLLRRAWSFWQYPNGDIGTNMQKAFRGHLVVLTDQFTYSDGETFTAAIKALNLGTVIGKQTAGAGVWLSGNNRLVDRGIARVAEFPVFSLDGNWLTEGRGISPDIEVDNMPYASYQGKDAQLEFAINYLKNKIEQSPIKPLTPLPFGPVDEAAGDIQRIEQ